MISTIVHHQIAGDWMTNGYIDNYNRARWLEIAVVDGKAYVVDGYGQPNIRDGRIDITADDELTAWGASTTFSPDVGEIDRIGRQYFQPI